MQNIGINLLWLRPGEVGGTETYVRRVLRALSEHSPDIGLHLYGTPSALEAARPAVRGVEEYITAASVLAPAKRVVVERTWLRSVMGPNLDVIHHPGGTVPFSSPGRSVVTIHDLQPLDDPSNFSTVKRRFMAKAIPNAVAHAEVVATPSDWVRERVLDRFDIAEDRVVTVSAFAMPPDLSIGTEPSPRLASILGRGPVLFYPAMTMRHKNHAMLFQAFAEAVRHEPDLQLVCVGAVGRDHEDIRGMAVAASPKIHLLGHVPRSDLDALYARSEALVFPSSYEGFGLPILEAQHAELPVIASSTTALGEVVGHGGVLLDPQDPSAWAHAMVHRLRGEDRARQIVAGRENAGRYSPEATAKQQRSAYERLTA